MFKHPCSLKKHEIIHMDKWPYECSVHHETFQISHYMERHSEIQMDVINMVRSLRCSLTFRDIPSSIRIKGKFVQFAIITSKILLPLIITLIFTEKCRLHAWYVVKTFYHPSILKRHPSIHKRGLPHKCMVYGKAILKTSHNSYSIPHMHLLAVCYCCWDSSKEVVFHS
jgi:hypothetical protein